MNGLLRDRVTITRGIVATSDSGETTQTFSAIAANVPAAVQARKGSYRQQEYGKQRSANFVAFFAKGTDVRVGDRILRASETFEVAFVADLNAHHLEADLAAITT